MMRVSKTGDWQRGLALLSRLGAQTAGAVKRSVLQEAHLLRKLIVEGITQQAPGGKPLQPISDLTRASRRLKGFLGTKALIVRADMRNSVAVVGKGDRAFVGVLRRARARDGSRLIDIAEVQEFGAGPTIIPVTPKMRRFLGVLFREAGGALPRSGGGHKDFVVLVVPPRPFLRPAGEIFTKGLRERFLRRLADQMQLEHR